MITVRYLPNASLQCFFCKERNIGGVMINKEQSNRLGIIMCERCVNELHDALTHADGEEIDEATTEIFDG